MRHNQHGDQDDEDGLEGYSGYERATRLYNDLLGTEDKDEWRAHAPDASHPSVDAEDDQ